MASDREVFLRKLEGRHELRTTSTSEDTLRFLNEAGIEVTLLDPASLEALEEMTTPKKKMVLTEDDNKPAAVSDSIHKKTVGFELPVSDAQPNRAFASSTSDITMTGLQSTTETNSSVAGSTEKSREDLILQQLEFQTQLILDLQNRIDYLANMVHHMSASVPPGATMSSPPPHQHHHSMHQPVSPFVQQPMHQQPRADFMPPVMIQLPRAAPIPDGPPPRPHQSLFGSLCEWILEIPARIRTSRTMEVWRVFLALHRRHVRLDGALMFKVVMMVAIFSAKFMSRSRKKTSGFWTATLKLNLVVVMVFVGFLIQSGYVNFFYRFFIQDKLVERIYAGENIDVDRIRWNDPAGPRNNRNNNLRNLVPRNHMLVGNIPAPRNGINILMDVVVLLGSFLLSILPMWKPEGQPQERQARMAQAQAQAQPNAVAPPPDLDQHEASDDDDDDEGELQRHAHQD